MKLHFLVALLLLSVPGKAVCASFEESQAALATIAPLHDLFSVPIDQTLTLSSRLGKFEDNTENVGSSLNNAKMKIRKALVFEDLPYALKLQNVGSVQINYFDTPKGPGMNIIVRAKSGRVLANDEIIEVTRLFDANADNWRNSPTTWTNVERGIFLQIPNKKGMIFWGGEFGKRMLIEAGFDE